MTGVAVGQFLLNLWLRPVVLDVGGGERVDKAGELGKEENDEKGS